MLNIGILGGGNVASGVINILQENGEYISKKTGKIINVKKFI